MLLIQWSFRTCSETNVKQLLMRMGTYYIGIYYVMFPWGLVPVQKIHGVLSAEDKSFLATPCKFSIANRKRRAGGWRKDV